MNWLLLASTLSLAVLLSVALYIYQSGTANLALVPAQPTLLIVGPSNAGKTSLFQKVVHDRRKTPTHTSLEANSGMVTLENGRKIKVVDVPGHPKLFGAFKSFAPTSITFVIDSSTLSKNVDTVSRSLLEVLTHARRANVAEISILANKSDFFTALSPERVVELIEAEFEQIRGQKDGVRMDSIEDKSEEDDTWLEDLPGPFRLLDECTVFGGSVLKDDITAWQEWVESSFS